MKITNAPLQTPAEMEVLFEQILKNLELLPEIELKIDKLCIDVDSFLNLPTK